MGKLAFGPDGLIPFQLVAQAGYAADDDQGWALQVFGGRALSKGGERSGYHLLIFTGSVVDYGGGQIGISAVADKIRKQLLKMGEAHIDGDGLIGLNEHLPIEVEFAVLAVTGDEDAGLGMVAVGLAGCPRRRRSRWPP